MHSCVVVPFGTLQYANLNCSLSTLQQGSDANFKARSVNIFSYDFDILFEIEYFSLRVQPLRIFVKCQLIGGKINGILSAMVSPGIQMAY